jgi:hypothetical protein
MAKHLKTHGKSPPEDSSRQASPGPAKKFKGCGSASTDLMSKFVVRLTRKEALAKCAAEDGFAIDAIRNSEAIKSYLTSKGFEMPKTASSIKTKVRNRMKSSRLQILVWLKYHFKEKSK